VLDFYTPLLDALGVTRARDLLTRRARADVLVAGVKVATQTPPVRSGRRVVFVTLDDSTGPIDATLFEDAQAAYAATVFHSWLLVVHGRIRRTGPRGISLQALACWELPALFEIWREQGTTGVQEAMARAPQPVATEEAVHGAAGSRSTRPVLAAPPVQHATGFQQSQWADIRPAGDSPRAAPRRLWHASSGSAG
jgi:error-prone DNA polymerase